MWLTGVPNLLTKSMTLQVNLKYQVKSLCNIYIYIYGGFPKLGVLFGDPHNEDYSILGSTLGSPCFGKVPYIYIYIEFSSRLLGLYPWPLASK